MRPHLESDLLAKADPFRDRNEFAVPDPFTCYANETTTSTLDDYTNASLVEPTVILALTERPGLMRFCREFNMIGKPALAISIPTETSYWGSANDRGASVATAFNATQATSISNTAVSSGNVSLTPAEYGVATALTDNVQEDSVPIDVLNQIMSRMLFVLAMAMEDDYLAQLVNLSQVVGVSGSPLTLAQAIAAQQGLRTRGVVADALAYIFDNKQASDMESLLMTTNAAAAQFALSADRLIGYAPAPDNGMGPSRQVMTLRGLPVFATGMTDTANAGVDVVGACVCPSSAFNDANGSTTHGMAWKRLPRFETQRQAKLRATDMVMTCRAGFVELQDGAGTSIVTKS
jgi:hypothetical protein